ncbi:hypothetical protein [Streptomyces sp. PKU-EA00015]
MNGGALLAAGLLGAFAEALKAAMRPTTCPAGCGASPAGSTFLPSA